MKKIMHVLNGDCSELIFSKTLIQGDTIVWRELLCDGPLIEKIASDAFWKKRLAYFEKNKLSSKEEYHRKVINELHQIQALDNYNEIVLWFEYDLFCQVNMLAACSMIFNLKKDITCSLICSGNVEYQEKKLGLGELKPNDFEKLFASRNILSKVDLRFADNCWNLFVNSDIEKLKRFNFSSNDKFEYLEEAMHQHVLRMPNEEGVTLIDKQILNHINLGYKTKKRLISSMLLWQEENTVYGFGDMQYEICLANLNHYYEFKNDTFILNNKGYKLLHEHGL